MFEDYKIYRANYDVKKIYGYAKAASTGMGADSLYINIKALLDWKLNDDVEGGWLISFAKFSELRARVLEMDRTPAEILDMIINSILVMGSRNHKPLETSMEALLMEKEFPPCDVLIAKWSAMLRLKEKNGARRVKHEIEKEGGLVANLTDMNMKDLKCQKRAVDREIHSRSWRGDTDETELNAYQGGIKNTFGPKTTESGTKSGSGNVNEMRCLLCGVKGHGARGCPTAKSAPHICGICKNVHFTGAHYFLVRNLKTWKTTSKEDQTAADADDEAWGYTYKKRYANHAEIGDQLECMMVRMNAEVVRQSPYSVVPGYHSDDDEDGFELRANRANIVGGDHVSKEIAFMEAMLAKDASSGYIVNYSCDEVEGVASEHQSEGCNQEVPRSILVYREMVESDVAQVSSPTDECHVFFINRDEDNEDSQRKQSLAELREIKTKWKEDLKNLRDNKSRWLERRNNIALSPGDV